MNLHPGVAASLRRLGIDDELGIAREIAVGELASPQRYHNLTLYNLRVTGTGVSYRPQFEEYVFRRPENYLTEEFLARCNGVPVIWEHPEKSLLNSKEFGDRIVGTIMFAYIRGDDVWAVARIYSQSALDALESGVVSTSPAVLLGDSRKIDIDGKDLLDEGKATLLCHLALVPVGIWDKGGPPTGVEQSLDEELAFADSAGARPNKSAKIKRLAGAVAMLEVSVGTMKSSQARAMRASR